MNMIFPCIILFLLPIAQREHRYISNIKHILSTVFKVIDRCQQQKKEKEANNMIKLVNSNLNLV